MPRTGMGAKPNRSDLNTAAPTGDDREYGANAEDEAAMAQIPVAPQEPIAAPGSLGPLGGPTTRPSEPVTTGVASGPGAGPESRLMRPPDPFQSPLQRAAMMTGNPRLKQMVRNRYGN